MNNLEMDKSLLNTINRIKAFKENKSVFKLGFITDVHMGGNEHYKALRYFSDSFSMIGYDCAINGGDIGLDLGESKEETERIIRLTKENMSQSVPFLFMKGNHDYGTQSVDFGYLSEMLQKPSLVAYPDKVKLVIDESNGGYGYYISKEKKMIVIFLNTSEGNTRRFIMSDDQIRFLINTLSELEEGYRVIVSGHLCIHDIGVWSSYQNDNKGECFKTVKMILNDFVNKRQGSLNDFSWDYKENKSKLVCYLAGDSHFNNYINDNGVNYVVRQGYGGVDPKEMPEGASHDKFSSNDGMEFEMCAFETLVVLENKCFVIRCGVGEKVRDLEFEF